MKLSGLLPKERIVVGLKGGARSKKELLAELLRRLLDVSPLKDEPFSEAELLEALMLREGSLSTAVGGGFAFPHARLQGLSRSYLLFAVSREGVEFSSSDGAPAHFFMLSLSPDSGASSLLQSRSALLRFMLKESSREAVLAAPDPEAIWKLLDSSDVSVERTVLASDLMRPQWGFLYEDMTLREAAMVLHRSQAESLPVVDERGRFQGELTCRDILSYGIPESLFMLKAVAFARNLDPFERYFQVDNSMTVGKLKSSEPPAALPPDATLMEVVFELAVRGRQTVYVVEAGRLLGVIDRSSLVDKVILSS